MILEAAMLQVKEGQEESFEDSFRQASAIISSMPGYILHELHRCMEAKGKYLLLVRWETLEDHTIGFRGSQEYQEWKQLLHHYYEPFPTVEHFEQVSLTSAPQTTHTPSSETL
ncbi:antibiotic biosynthesis monooxygenase family protein [Brevibacillus migulae]|uniref:antibiotic biosynthesis monooxygenase family protein n=1 Tax=Brevibacillus migulae TaxID=1644114 RepID=UPI00106DE4A3|nr:antibiotic biosynthesis monooxygenase [Brevibacillus migulae]